MRPRIPGPVPRTRDRLESWLTRLVVALAWLLAACLPIAGSSTAGAANDHIEELHAAIDARDDGYYFSGEFDLELKPRIAEALERGLTLYFQVDVELTRSRWYWFDERPVSASLTQRLSYHALTRQYRVSSGNLQVGFPTLSEALAVIGHVRDWKIAERGALNTGEVYTVRTRMRLDTTQLPKPFQINALTNRDWVLESEWKRFTLEPR